jgi:branched-subunit amino acid ABC-type transport system permease component
VDLETFWLLTGFGLISGGLLALAAVGMSMLVGVTGFLNFAYGEWLTLAAFFALSFSTGLHLNVWVAAVGGIAAITIIGTLLAWATFEPIARRSSMTLLITSMGLAFVLQNVVILIWGTDLRRFEIPVGLLQAHEIGPFRMTTLSLATIVLSLVAMLLVALLLRLTELGRQMRAVAADPELARAVGIDVRRIRLWTWVIGSCIAGAAGVLLGMTSEVGPTMGFDQLLVISAAVIAGGFGNMYGAACAAFLLGLAMQWSTEIVDPSLKGGTAFLVLILVLLLRPEGLFTRRAAVA